jgi:Cyanobacterial TRADD-N associated 2-Transmembrane domain
MGTDDGSKARENIARRRISGAAESLHDLRRKIRLTRWILVGSILATGVATTAGGRAVARSERATAVTLLVPAGALLTVALALVGVLLIYGDKIRVKQFTIQTEEEADELEHAGGTSLGPYMAFSHRQMTRFECVALTQATLSHLASLIAAGLGFLVLVSGAWITLTRTTGDATVTGAVMTGIGTALSGFLSVTFLRTFQITTRQMSYYYGQPMVNCYLLHAERLLERCDRGLGAEQRREDVQDVVATILDVARTAQSHLTTQDGTPIALSRSSTSRKTDTSGPRCSPRTPPAPIPSISSPDTPDGRGNGR